MSTSTRTGSPAQGGESIRVYVRVRPPNSNELAARGDHCSLQHLSFTGDSSTTITAGLGGNERTFNLDGAFPSDASQKTVYESAALPIVEAVLEGFNGTVLAYGQTGTGKTHTIEGMRMGGGKRRRMRSMDTATALGGAAGGCKPVLLQEDANHGVIPRMVHTVFSHIAAADADVEFQIKLSICEIYLERIRDLLVAPPKPKQRVGSINPHNLRIRESPKGDIYIEGLSDWYVSSPDEIFEAFGVAQNNRSVSETNMNAASSRSHLLFILTVVQATQSGIKLGKLCLVDLAGSEKVSKSGADGLTLEEAKQINKSLSALGNVINALTSASKSRHAAHIPYRSSKLTRALQESLGGNSKTCLICTVSPSELHDSETLSTLRFGQRAKLITNAAHVNQELTIDELKKIVTSAEAKLILQAHYISVLRRHITSSNTSPPPPIPTQLLLMDSLPPSSIAAYDSPTTAEEVDAENIPAENLNAPAAQVDTSSAASQLSDDTDELCTDDDSDQDTYDVGGSVETSSSHLLTPNADPGGCLLTTPTTTALSDSFRLHIDLYPKTSSGLHPPRRSRSAPPPIQRAPIVVLPHSVATTPRAHHTPVPIARLLHDDDDDEDFQAVEPVGRAVLTSVPTTPVYVQGTVSASLGDGADTAYDVPVTSLMDDPESVRAVIEKTQKLAMHLDQLTVLYHRALHKNADLQGQSTVKGREMKRLDETVTELKRELHDSREQYSRLLQRCSQLSVAMEGISLPKMTNKASNRAVGSSAASTSSGTSSNKLRPNASNSTSGSWYRGGNSSNFSFAGFNAAKRWLNITKPLRGGGGKQK